MTASHESVTTSHETVTTSHESVTASHESVTASHETVTTSHETVTTSHETVTTSHETVTTSHGSVTTSHETVTTSHETVTTSHETVTTSHETVTDGPQKHLHAVRGVLHNLEGAVSRKPARAKGRPQPASSLAAGQVEEEEHHQHFKLLHPVVSTIHMMPSSPSPHSWAAVTHHTTQSRIGDCLSRFGGHMSTTNAAKRAPHGVFPLHRSPPPQHPPPPPNSRNTTPHVRAHTVHHLFSAPSPFRRICSPPESAPPFRTRISFHSHHHMQLQHTS